MNKPYVFFSKDEVIEAIKTYFEENEDTFTECIEELDSYNGYLGDDRYYEMYMIDEFYSECKPSELLDRIYYGHDDENGDSSEFCPNREYFYYNGYGNLVSSDYKDYSAHLDSYAIESMSEHRNYIDAIDRDEELSELFDILEEAETLEA